MSSWASAECATAHGARAESSNASMLDDLTFVSRIAATSGHGRSESLEWPGRVVRIDRRLVRLGQGAPPLVRVTPMIADRLGPDKPTGWARGLRTFPSSRARLEGCVAARSIVIFKGTVVPFFGTGRVPFFGTGR